MTLFDVLEHIDDDELAVAEVGTGDQAGRICAPQHALRALALSPLPVHAPDLSEPGRSDGGLGARQNRYALETLDEMFRGDQVACAGFINGSPW